MGANFFSVVVHPLHTPLPGGSTNHTRIYTDPVYVDLDLEDMKNRLERLVFFCEHTYSFAAWRGRALFISRYLVTESVIDQRCGKYYSRYIWMCINIFKLGSYMHVFPKI